MRRFGRSCRGQAPVFVTLVRHTEQQLLALGEPIKTCAQQAKQRLAQPETLREPQRARFARQLSTAMRAHAHIRRQSTWLTPGKKLHHFTLVNAYDPTIAPMIKGKSNCPAQFGRKPGIVSEPATGFLFANRVPKGNPSDSRSVLPLLDKVQRATERVQTGPRRPIHSVAGDLGLHDPGLRQALHERSMLTVGIPKRVEPIKANPSAEDVRDMLLEAGLHRKRTPHPGHLACASG